MWCIDDINPIVTGAAKIGAPPRWCCIAVFTFHLSRVRIIHERSSWHDAGGAEDCHLRGDSLSFISEDSEADDARRIIISAAATTAFITQAEWASWLLINIYNTFGPIITFLHHLLSANYPAFVPFLKGGLKTFLWRRKSDSDDISRYLGPGNVGIFLHLFNYSHLITSAVTDPRIIMRHISTPYPLAPSLLSVKHQEFDRIFYKLLGEKDRVMLRQDQRTHEKGCPLFSLLRVVDDNERFYNRV